MRQVNGDVVLSGALGAGTTTSQQLPTNSADVLVMIHATAVSGTSPSLAVSLEQSNDGSSWSAVPSSAAPAVTAAGNAFANARVTQQLCRVTATVSGTATPTVTCRVAVLAFAD